MAFSVPAERIRKTFLLVDGSRVDATFVGDEFGAYYMTDNNQLVLKTDSGFILASSQVAEVAFEDGIQRLMAKRKVGSVQTAALKPSGRKYVPVVLVSFADKDFSVASTDKEVQDYYELFCNGSRNGSLYTGHGSRGSIKDYFLDQSYGQFEPEFIPIGPVQLDNVYAYYGADRYNSNGTVSSYDVNFSLFRNEAISKAMEHCSDWSVFDNDSNGSVDMVFFIYAGLGQNNGGDDNTIWPKESTNGVTIAGQHFSTSAACCEARPSKRDEQGNIVATKADGIGVFIHELSHALGLPDFYDTRNVAFGMDMWSVMDYGEYCNNGYNPSNYTAYERNFMGWEELPELSGPATVRLECFANGGRGLKVVNDRNPDEYYVVENRQALGWDDYLGRVCTGLQVTHVDYLSTAWNTNRVNIDPKHQRMTIIAANDCYKGTNSATSNAEYLATLKGNLFPGSQNTTCLTDETTPASVVYTGGYMGKPIYDISEHKDGSVTFKYCPSGVLPMTDSVGVRDVTASSFTACWKEVPDAQAYRLKLISSDETLLLCDSLKITEYCFDNLQPDMTYSFAVQAISDTYRDGEWCVSESVNISTDIPSLSVETKGKVLVYDLLGNLLGTYMNNSFDKNLQNGIYVIKQTGGKTRKIYVK